MSTLVKERFVDYLFMLEGGEIPPVVKPMVIGQEGNVVRWDNGQIRGALILGSAPYDANMPQLGFALFYELWPQVLDGVDKLIRKRMRERGG